MYLKFEKKLNLRGAHCLDIATEDGEVYHGNYRGCRSASCVKRWITETCHLDLLSYRFTF